jgi:hypothetical protein
MIVLLLRLLLLALQLLEWVQVLLMQGPCCFVLLPIAAAIPILLLLLLVLEAPICLQELLLPTDPDTSAQLLQSRVLCYWLSMLSVLSSG